jgi:hypothetical protein
MTKLKILLDDLTEDEAYALAQMCKRITWDDFKKLSANHQAARHEPRGTEAPPRACRGRV